MRQFASTIDTRNLWDRHIRNVFSWETLGGVALATAGGLLMCFGAEVPGAMLIGAGGDMVFQQVVRGHVDYGEVALSGALAPTGGSGLSEIAGLGTRTLLTRGIEAGTTQGYVMGQLPLGNITRAPQRRNLPRASRRRNTQRRRLRRHHRHDRRKKHTTPSQTQYPPDILDPITRYSALVNSPRRSFENTKETANWTSDRQPHSVEPHSKAKSP